MAGRRPRYEPQNNSYHLSDRRVRFIPVKDGDVVELGDTSTPQTGHYAHKPRHVIIGFKPGPGPRAEGWLVVLVDEAESGRSAPHRKRSLRAGS